MNINVNDIHNLENPIMILDTSNISDINTTSASLMSLGGAYLEGDLVVSNLFVTGTTASFADNILLLNTSTTDGSDMGLVMQRLNTHVSDNNNFAAIIYSEISDEFCFGYLQNDPNRENISFQNFAPIHADSLQLRSNTNAIGFTTGGAFTNFGGGAIAQDLYVGCNLFVGKDINYSGILSGGSLVINNAIINNLSVGSVLASSGNVDLNFFYTDSTFPSTTVSTIFQDKINITTSNLTIDSYLIQFAYKMSTSNNFRDYQVRLILNGAQEYISTDTNVRFTDDKSHKSFLVKTLPGGPQTLQLQYRKVSGPGSITISDAKILLYNISFFDSYQSSALFSSSTTSNQFQTQLSDVSPVLPSGTYVVLFTYKITTGNNFGDWEVQFFIDSMQQYISSSTNIRSSDTPVYTYFVYITFPSETTHTLLFQYRKVGTGNAITISNVDVLLFKIST